MPRKATTPEEKALKQQVEDLIKSIKGNDKPGPDINRALGLFKKAQANINQAIAVLEGTEVEEEVDPNKKKAGRPKKAAAGADGDLFPADASQNTDPDAPKIAVKITPVKNKKGAATEAENA